MSPITQPPPCRYTNVGYGPSPSGMYTRIGIPSSVIERSMTSPTGSGSSADGNMPSAKRRAPAGESDRKVGIGAAPICCSKPVISESGSSAADTSDRVVEAIDAVCHDLP